VLIVLAAHYYIYNKYEPQSRSAWLWLGVKPADSDNYMYQVRSAPDARRPLQKSQNGVDADQVYAIPQS